MGQIKYFPLEKSKILTPEEKRDLIKLQDFISGAKNGMENRIANYDTFWKNIERSLFHNEIRSKIREVDKDFDIELHNLWREFS